MPGEIKKLSIVIPIFNEAPTVLQLLESVYQQNLPNNLVKEMIIVESNSTDGTRELVRKFVTDKANSGNSQTQVRLVLQDKALGKGNATRQGLELATGDVVLIQDGDLEYDVNDYPILVQPIIDGHTDFVLGSRHLSAGHWKIRRFEESPLKSFYMNIGGTLFHGLFNFVYRVRLTDPTTMYKVFLRKCIDGVQFESNRFDFDYELVAKLIRLGYLPLEVPVSYKSRGFASGKKINMLRDPFMWVWAIFKFRIMKIRRVSRMNQMQSRQIALEREWSEPAMGLKE